MNKCPLCGKQLIRVGDATTNTTWLKCPICCISAPVESFKSLCETIKVGEHALASVPEGYQITQFKCEEMCDETQREWSQIVAEIEPIPLTMENVLLRCRDGLELARTGYDYSPDPQLFIDIDTVLDKDK